MYCGVPETSRACCSVAIILTNKWKRKNLKLNGAVKMIVFMVNTYM